MGLPSFLGANLTGTLSLAWGSPRCPSGSAGLRACLGPPSMRPQALGTRPGGPVSTPQSNQLAPLQAVQPARDSSKVSERRRSIVSLSHTAGGQGPSLVLHLHQACYTEQEGAQRQG